MTRRIEAQDFSFEMSLVLPRPLVNPRFEQVHLFVGQLLFRHQGHLLSERGIQFYFLNEYTRIAVLWNDRFSVLASFDNIRERLHEELAWVLAVRCVAREAPFLDYGEDIV